MRTAANAIAAGLSIAVSVAGGYPLSETVAVSSSAPHLGSLRMLPVRGQTWTGLHGNYMTHPRDGPWTLQYRAAGDATEDAVCTRWGLLAVRVQVSKSHSQKDNHAPRSPGLCWSGCERSCFGCQLKQPVE